MVTERFTVVALPHSVSTGADFHVSLFVSPQLTPDGPRAKLRRFHHFPHWAGSLKDAGFELWDQIGPIPTTPLLGPVSPAAWDAVFPPDTPVRAPHDLDYGDRHWRTFRAGEVHDDAKLLHVAAMYADPTSPPPPSVHPLTGLLGRTGLVEGGISVRATGRREYDESRITAVLDEQIGEGDEPMSLAELERRIDAMGPDEAFLRLAVQVHRARRFYERPESQLPYRREPKANPSHTTPPRPEPDFHERCSLVGDHPALQRRLGLVVDLVADDPDRLRESQWLSARIVAQGDETASLATKTRCRVAGADLVTIPEGDEWEEERLRLGDEERFALLDVDPDGAALKVDRFLWTVPRLLGIEENGDPIHAAPTALRSIGFTVVRHKKALETQARVDHQATLRGAVTGGGSPLLSTEDVTQGLRVEVWDDTAKGWFTLHARRIDARTLDHGRIVRDLLEEGFIQGTTATETEGVDNSPVHVHESVFGWEGWSLSAARPGKRVRHENGDEIVEPQDAHPDHVTPLVLTSEVQPGTLPRLRYGRKYAFRAWAVNLAGTSRAHPIGPSPAPGTPAVESAAAALSTAPVAAPGALLLPTLRSETAAGILRRRFVVARDPEEAAEADLSILGDAGIEAEVLGRLRARRAEPLDRGRTAPGVTADRASSVSRAFGDAAVDESGPFIVDTRVRDAAALAAAGIMPGTNSDEAPLDVITALRP